VTTVWLRCSVLVILVQACWAATGWAQETMLVPSVEAKSDHILSSEEVAKLLIRPECFGSAGDTVRPYLIQDYVIPSKGISLSGQLYLPSERGRWPLVILIPGGFNARPS
jgi:hypothetical protein